VHWCSGYPQRSSWGEPTASDELYSCSGWRPWVESKLIIESGWGLDLRLAGWHKLGSANKTWLGGYDLMWSEPWHSPPPQRNGCPDVHWPVAQSIGTSLRCHEVDDGVEGEFGEVDGQNVLGASGFLAMEFGYKSPHTFWRLQMVSICLPLCHIPSNVQGTQVFLWRFGCRVWFYLIFLDTIADNRGGGSCWTRSVIMSAL